MEIESTVSMGWSPAETKVKDNIIKELRKYTHMTHTAFRPLGSRLFAENLVTKWAVKKLIRKAMTICQG